ncbi:hypothetical protein ACFSTI_22430 [Rhizorhabdus histidinilytica]
MADETGANGAIPGGAVLPPMGFGWLDEELPAGPWSSALRGSLCDAMKTLGWAAVHAGEFAPLEHLYRDFATIFPGCWSTATISTAPPISTRCSTSCSGVAPSSCPN